MLISMYYAIDYLVSNSMLNLDHSFYFRAQYVPHPITYRLAPAYINIFKGRYTESDLEQYILTNRLITELLRYRQTHYAPKSNYTFQTSVIIHDPEVLLVPSRPETEFVENLSAKLRREIERIFFLTTGFELPKDILISVLSESDLEREHSKYAKHWSPRIQGFSINRKHLLEFSSIFIKENPQDILMLTIGHEIGHCLSIKLADLLMEEAKAFAFEIAWMKTIHKHHVLGLKDCINLDILRPSNNGVHDAALAHVLRQLQSMSALELFSKIIKYYV